MAVNSGQRVGDVDVRPGPVQVALAAPFPPFLPALAEPPVPPVVWLRLPLVEAAAETARFLGYRDPS